MAKFYTQLILSLMVMFAVGHAVQSEWKVVYGFICGSGIGAWLYPAYIRMKILRELRLKGIMIEYRE